MKLNQHSRDIVKQYAVMYKDICEKEGPAAYAQRYRQDYEYEVISHAEVLLAQQLSDVYLALSAGKITRAEARTKQNELLDNAETEHGELIDSVKKAA